MPKTEPIIVIGPGGMFSSIVGNRIRQRLATELSADWMHFDSSTGVGGPRRPDRPRSVCGGGRDCAFRCRDWRARDRQCQHVGRLRLRRSETSPTCLPAFISAADRRVERRCRRGHRCHADRRRHGRHLGFLGAGAVVVRDIADGVTAVGVPARPSGSISQCRVFTSRRPTRRRRAGAASKRPSPPTGSHRSARTSMRSSASSPSLSASPTPSRSPRAPPRCIWP